MSAKSRVSEPLGTSLSWGTCVTLSAGTLQAALLAVEFPSPVSRWLSFWTTQSLILDLLHVLPPLLTEPTPGHYKVAGLAAATKRLVSHLHPDEPVQCLLLDAKTELGTTTPEDLAMFARDLIGDDALMAWLIEQSNWDRWSPLLPLTGKNFGEAFGFAREKGRLLIQEARNRVDEDSPAQTRSPGSTEDR